MTKNPQAMGWGRLTIGRSLRWICVALFSTVVLACRAPSKAWNGTWKLNVAKSSLPGPDFSITAGPAGEYHYDSGNYSYNFRCDGKEYPTTADGTISCVQTSSSAMDTTAKKSGATLATAHWEVSPDQKTLTIDGTRVRPTGPAQPRKTVYVRIFGSTGLGGGWRNPRRLESHPQVMVLTLNERSLRLAFLETEQSSDLKLDGTDSPMHDSRLTPGFTLAIKPNGPREFLTTKKFRGQTLNQGSLTLSADGRSVTETYWRPGMPQEKAVLVYERQ